MTGSQHRWQWRNAHLMILVAVVAQSARIFSTSGASGDNPFHSANDRSRWCTVAALVEDGTYQIDRLLDIRDRKGNRTWYTIDLVQHRGRDGRQHFYSSKPPLLATLYASVYAPIYWILGVKLSEHPYYVGRLMLVIINLLPLALVWVWFSQLIPRVVQGSWSRSIVLGFLLWGTFLSTFTVTMNNHLPAAIAITVSLAAWMRVAKLSDARPRWFAIAGCAAAFATTCDLPALCWFVTLFGLLSPIDWRRTLVWYSLGALPVAIAFAATTYIAHDDLRPPYAHRRVGAQIAMITKSTENEVQPKPAELVDALKNSNIELSQETLVRPARLENTWELWDEAQQQRFAIVDAGANWQVCHWDDWYDYPNSYWYPKNKRGVDRGEPLPRVYFFHMLVGHHGILSLTPMWILALIGGAMCLHQRDRQVFLLVAGILVVTLVCLVFYATRPQIDRNYGGITSGFRWLFWLIPLWLVLVMRGMPVISRSRWGRRLTEVALGVSIFSSVYPWTNPWVHPWLYSLWTYLGWIDPL